MLRFIKYVLQYFKHQRQDLTVPQQTDDMFHSIPGYTTIETNIDNQPIPGTITQSISKEERILQSPNGELITHSNKKGIHCGCGHLIYTIESNGQQPGLGSRCPICAAQAVQLLNRGDVTLDQAEAMSLCCSKCSARCEGCGINVCRRHIHQFIGLDNSRAWLCDECVKQAERDKFFKQTLTIMFSPFLDDNSLPPPAKKRGPNEL